MINGLFWGSLLFIAVEILMSGLVTGFLQPVFSIKDIFKLLLPSVIVTLMLKAGYNTASFASQFVNSYTMWYSATIMFILAMKMVYDGIKLYKLKQMINPIDTKGLIILSFLTGINSFFIGMSFGFAGMFYTTVYMALPFLIFIAIAGYVLGFRFNKLPAFKIEYVAAVFYFITAVIIINL